MLKTAADERGKRAVVVATSIQHDEKEQVPLHTLYCQKNPNPAPDKVNDKSISKMDSPLSAISPSKANALSSKIPTPMNLTPSKSPSKSPAGNINKTPILVRNNADEDDINWDEGPSSPFLSEVVEDKENLHNMFSRSTSSTAPTEVIPRHLDDIGVEVTSRAPRTPFQIAEDETCTFHTSKSIISTSRASSPTKPVFSRASTHESIIVTSQSSHESRSSHRVISYGTDIGDITMNEDPNIDDTCFSTFSEVPNTDMTAFANLGQHSPTKQMLFDQASQVKLFVEKHN